MLTNPSFLSTAKCCDKADWLSKTFSFREPTESSPCKRLQRIISLFSLLNAFRKPEASLARSSISVMVSSDLGIGVIYRY